jgi:hypothetical protein
MKKIYFIGVLLTLSLLSGCSTLKERQDREIARGFYAAQDAAKVGRFDLSKKYLDETSKLIAPPKDKIKISPVLDKDKKAIVIIPDEFKGVQVSLKPTSEEFLKQFKKEDSDLFGFSKKIDQVIREKENIFNKEGSKPSFLHRLGGWFNGIFGFSIFSIVSLGILCLFFPTLIPLLLNIFSAIGSIINWIFQKLSDSIKAFRK